MTRMHDVPSSSAEKIDQATAIVADEAGAGKTIVEQAVLQ